MLFRWGGQWHARACRPKPDINYPHVQPRFFPELSGNLPRNSYGSTVGPYVVLFISRQLSLNAWQPSLLPILVALSWSSTPIVL